MTCPKHLVLHGNDFEAVAGLTVRKKKYQPKHMLLFDNRLSCLPSSIGTLAPKLGLIVVGNRLRKCSNSWFPSWVTPMEKDNLLWVSGRDGLDLFQTIAGAIGIMGASILVHRSDGLLLLDVLSKLQYQHATFAMVCRELLDCMARVGLARVSSLLFLLHWNYFRCPSTLTLASACQRSDRLTPILVLLAWCQLGFYPPAFERARPSTAKEAEQQDRKGWHRIIRRFLLWMLWILLVLMLSSISMTYQAAKSIPGFLGAARLGSALLGSCVGLLVALKRCDL